MKRKITIKDDLYLITKNKDDIYTIKQKDSIKSKLPWFRKSTGRMIYKIKDRKEVLAAKVIYLAINYNNPKLEEYKNYICVFKDKNPLNINPENIDLLTRSEYKKLKLNSKKIIMIPDGREFDSLTEAGEYLSTIGNGNPKTYIPEISRIINYRKDEKGYKRITILGKSFKYKNEK